MRRGLVFAAALGGACTAAAPSVPVSTPPIAPVVAGVAPAGEVPGEVAARPVEGPEAGPSAGAPREVAIAAGLSGTWSGTYVYVTRSASTAGAPAQVAFFAELEIDEQRVRGSVIEPNTLDDDTGGELRATLVGAIDAEGVVRFTKRYDGRSDVTQQVEYVGRLDAAAARIEGTWSTATSSGRFVMKRDRPMPQVAQARRMPGVRG